MGRAKVQSLSLLAGEHTAQGSDHPRHVGGVHDLLETHALERPRRTAEQAFEAPGGQDDPAGRVDFDVALGAVGFEDLDPAIEFDTQVERG